MLELGILSTTEIAAFQKKINKNLARFRKVIKFNEARHIIKMHSKSYERLNRQVEISAEHFMNIPDVLLTYTDYISAERSCQRQIPGFYSFYKRKLFNCV